MMMAGHSSSGAPPILVNGTGITASQINTEIQYHPAERLVDAQRMAMRALVVRELLLQEALRLGICDDRCNIKDEQVVIDQLLDREIKVPEPDRESCERYYKSNKSRFVTSPLFQVSHILIPGPEDDREAHVAAKMKAEEIISILKSSPERFAEMARQHSTCSSKKDGGQLGQISKGQTTPEFEEALFGMKKKEISATPVKTRYGYHVIQVHDRAEGKEMPFEAAYDWIASYLRQNVWQRAVSQYISVLAGKADIKGFQLKSADSPLVQ